MEKFITDERTGLKYELVGDYYLVAGDDEAEDENKPIGISGQRHLRFIKKNKRSLYTELITTGKLNSYLAGVDNEANDTFLRLVKQLAEKQGVTEHLKADDQLLWVQKMNNIRNSAQEVVLHDFIYA